MEKNYLSIQEAADLSNKSIQTIRRAIKSKKLKVKRSKTPQGFNYLIEKESLNYFYGFRAEESKKEEAVKENSAETPKKVDESMTIETNDFKSLIKTLEGILNQHNDERQNFLRLVSTLQEKIFVLENQLNLLKAPERKWYQLWK